MRFHAETIGRPGLPPGIYFRLPLVGYFEGIAERGIAWHATGPLAFGDFFGIGPDQVSPEHSTILCARRLIDLETPRAVFTCVLQCLVASPALRSIVRRDTGQEPRGVSDENRKGIGHRRADGCEASAARPQTQAEGLD